MHPSREIGHRLLASAALSFLLPLSALAQTIDPCRAFSFYTQSSGDWKATFTATLGHYEALAAASATTPDGARYVRLIDSILDCYSLRLAGPRPPVSASNPYSAMVRAFHSFPTGPTVVDAGLGRDDLEELKEVYPSLEDFLNQTKAVQKTSVTHADAALFDWLHFLSEEYPARRFERDRKHWRSVFERRFELALRSLPPGLAFQKSFLHSKNELAQELEPLRRRFESAAGDSPELRLVLNRKDVFSYLFIDGLLARELLQAGWDRFGASSVTMATRAQPGPVWIEWLNALTETGQQIQTTLREHAPAVTNPVFERVLLLRKNDPKSVSPAVLDSFTSQLTSAESASMRQFTMLRASLSGVNPSTTTAVQELIRPDFSQASTLKEVIRVLRGYSALATQNLFDSARREVNRTSPENEILSSIEFSPYAIEHDLHGPALAETVLTELARLDGTEQRRENAEAFRRVLSAVTLSLSEQTSDADIAAAARAFAAARSAKAQIDFVGSDYFFSERLEAVRLALGYRKADLFRKIYRDTVLKDCNSLWKPFRRIWLAW